MPDCGLGHDHGSLKGVRFFGSRRVVHKVLEGEALTHEFLRQILANQEKTMSAIDDLNTAVSTAVTAMDAAVTAIKGGTANTAAIEAAVTTLNTASTALNAAITPPPAP